ncbi:MAG: type IX secretion system membrane protein PorP/SprF [Bacteroidales bacterium]|jgi:type IX secretion system PorP/SprF family membrane protein|nr:type IX secretion system membrane protein PorP/SprF [Bacteroidales bacterium]MCK9498187.1 type IX secretion system membrane protein PorP/SprF [Bacteroidales bacterium]MDY0313506.1 type IX secretion system membrane protein PorP/SprF [Bacteroidales bacterium]
MRKVLLLVMFLGSIFVKYSLAQVDPHFSLFEYSQNIYNPGAAGSNNAMCVTSLHRQQWVGFKEEGRPITSLFTFDMPIANIIGVGLNIQQDIIGFQKDLSVGANLAYRLDLDPGTLGIGLGLGIINRSIDGNWITNESLNGQPVYRDPNIPHMESVTSFDLNFGATFVGDAFWIGLSSTHLLEPTIKYDIDNPSYIARHYYLTGGYEYSLPNPSFDLIGTAMVQSDGSTVEAQINGKLLFNKSFWGGLSFRYSDAIVPMIGVHLISGLSFAYSYDVSLVKIGSNILGSHELMVRYCFNVSRDRTPGRHRGVRRL